MKQKALYGWKVCDENNRSLVVSLRDGGVKYLIGKYVSPQPKHGPLAVFTTRKLAREFEKGISTINGQINRLWGGNIYKCKYFKSGYKSLWNKHDKLLDLPTGTDFASKVMLLKRAR